MRQLIASTFVSADGVMQAPGGPTEDPTGGFPYGGWTVPYFDEVAATFIGDLFAKPFDLVLGRKTYEIFAAYWPFYNDPDHGHIADAFNRATKYVASRKGTALTWENSVALPDAAADLARLKQTDGPDLIIQGSGVLIQSLLRENLIDRFTLLTFPVVLGKGKRFFADDAPPMALTPETGLVTPSGVVIATYAPAGPVKTGAYGPDTPSDLERARRAKWKAEG